MVVGIREDDAYVAEANMPKELPAGRTLVLTLRRAKPPISFHGSARQGICMNTKFTIHCEQLRWLEANVFKGGLALLRPVDAWAGMKSHFSDMIRVATMTPMWLEKDQIGDWLAGKKSDEKARRKQIKQGVVAAPQPVAPLPVRSKRKASPANGKAAAKKRPKKRNEEPPESEPEASGMSGDEDESSSSSSAEEPDAGSDSDGD